MTRRDYCSECSNLVCDYDVFCDNCGRSTCYACIKDYDVLSRLAMLQARFKVLCEPTITQIELIQFFTPFNISNADYL
jgi:hypothetical protein